MREIRLILTANPVLEGAGVHLQRVFGYHNKPNFDPFLMMDDFRNDDPDKYLAGFPWHPHRGIETITYMLEGSAEHGDSMGNMGTIGKGDVQWMTAGSGIIHQEMPKPDESGRMYGFQVWTNLPASHKMMNPRYQEIKAQQIPCVQTEAGVQVRVICGVFEGVKGPVEDIMIDPQYWDIFVPAHQEFYIPTVMDYTALLYCYEGEAFIRDQRLQNRQVVLFEQGLGIKLRSGDAGVRLLFLCGKPLHEPIAWRGPIVMNSQEEIKEAYSDLSDNTFIKK